MGGSTSKSEVAQSKSAPLAQPQGECPVPHDQRSKFVEHAKNVSKEAEQKQEVKEECPVPHDQRSKFVEHAKALSNKKETKEGCDSDTLEKAAPVVYNVYGEVIDPKNMMPNPNQLPFPGQRKPLSVERAQSTIPKGGTEGTWAYPSPQMFFNSLNRKGKAEDVTEDDMEVIISIHNNMNEKTWKEVMMWEKILHEGECPKPKLLKFRGRPTDFTPKARFYNIVLGIPLPFDRHDWTVDRCGTQVRYIIDYYYNNGQESGNPITVDVRPALDGFGSFLDRVKMGVKSITGQTTAASYIELDEKSKAENKNYVNLVKKADERDIVTEEEFKFLSDLNVPKLGEISKEVKSRCKNAFDSIQTCKSEDECIRASLAMSVCMGSIVCPEKTKAFVRSAEDKKQMNMEPSNVAYSDLSSCLERFERQAIKIRTYAEGVKKAGENKQQEQQK